MAMKQMLAFKRKCNSAAELSGLVEPDFYPEPDRPACQFEDDGALHVVRGGIRAVFDVSHGQDLTGAKQNENTRAVMNHLGIKVAGNCLVDEAEENEVERCPHCGGEL